MKQIIPSVFFNWTAISVSDLELKTVTVPFIVTVQGVLKIEGRGYVDTRQGAEEGLAELVDELNESGS